MPRRSGPGVGLCLGLVASVAAAGACPLSFQLRLILAVLPSAAFVALAAYQPSLVDPAVRRFWLPSIVGMVAGLLVYPGGPTLGIPQGRVRVFQAVALEDSAARSAGGSIHRLGLIRVGDGEVMAGARGSVRVLDPGGPLLRAGDAVTVRAGLKPAGRLDREDFVTLAQRGDVRLDAPARGLLGLRRAAREALEVRIRQMGYPVSGFFQALFTGDRSSVDPGLELLFRDSGCLHVLALSGAHLVLVWGIAHFAVRLLRWRLPRAALPLAATVTYVLLAGPLPSLLRALAMLVVAWIARELDREPGATDVLGMALAVIVLCEPRMLFDLSFQLSAVAVAGMVTIGMELAERIARYVPRAAALPLCAGFGAQTAVAPLLMAAVGVFQPIGVLSGLVVAPLSVVLMLGGLIDLAVPVEWVGWAHVALGAGLHGVYRIMEACLGFFASFPAWRSGWAVAAWCLAVLALLAARPAARAAGPLVARVRIRAAR